MPVDSSLEKPLPNSLDAERSVLGAILLDNNALNVAIENLRIVTFEAVDETGTVGTITRYGGQGAEQGRDIDIDVPLLARTGLVRIPGASW